MVVGTVVRHGNLPLREEGLVLGAAVHREPLGLGQVGQHPLVDAGPVHARVRAGGRRGRGRVRLSAELRAMLPHCDQFGVQHLLQLLLPRLLLPLLGDQRGKFVGRSNAADA